MCVVRRHIQTGRHVYTHIHTYVCTYAHTCMTCIHTNTLYSHLLVVLTAIGVAADLSHIETPAKVVCVCVFVCVRVCVCVRMYVCTYIHVYQLK